MLVKEFRLIWVCTISPLVIPNDDDYVYRGACDRTTNSVLVFCPGQAKEGNASTIPAIRLWLRCQPKLDCKAKLDICKPIETAALAGAIGKAESKNGFGANCFFARIYVPRSAFSD